MSINDSDIIQYNDCITILFMHRTLQHRANKVLLDENDIYQLRLNSTL